MNSKIDIQPIVKSNKDLEHFLNVLPVAIYSCDKDGTITLYNTAVEKLCGRKLHIGKDLWYDVIKMYSPDGPLLRLHECPMYKTLKDGLAFTDIELIIERPDGSRSHVLLNTHPEFNEENEITGAFNTIIDITDQVIARKIREESEMRYRLMADLMPEKVTHADADGNLLYYNQQWFDYTGLNNDELLENGWGKLVHSEDVKEMKSRLKQAVKTGDPMEMEFRCRNKKGDFDWHLYRTNPVKDENGKVLMWFGTATEIEVFTKQKTALELSVIKKTTELREANDDLQRIKLEVAFTREKLLSEYSRSLIEASLDPLVTISTEGKITDMNEATAVITGVCRENLIGTDIFDYFSDPKKARRVYKEIFSKGSVAESPLTLRHINGKLTDVLFNGSVYKDPAGNILGVVIVARDVTNQNRISKELTEAIVSAQLATGIAEEAKQKAELATQIAEDAVKAKQQFLSNMSHEIRTPMNAIIGFTKVVLKTDLTVKQKEYVNAIKQSGNALIVLINDILDLAKVDSGKMVFENIPFKLESSIASMIHLFETKIEEKNLKLVKQFDPKIPVVLLGDPVRLHQVILNLVSNAVKFTNKGKITIASRLLQEDDERVKIEFSVADTGIGIAEDKIESVFENFQQASSGTSRLYGGTGLGLAIAKQLVEAQQGTIVVESKIDEGSTFKFTLSFQKTDGRVEPDAELLQLDTKLKNIKVLVVEDMVLNQLLMKTLLDDFGFERDIAANGKIAIDKLSEKDYDIILMDLQMPEMNGFEATEYIRKILYSTIPIIALTADVTTVDLAKCKAVGMNDYITKPVDERVLYSKIIGLVKKPVVKTSGLFKINNKANTKPAKCTDLSYLVGITKNNPKLMMEMIAIYLEQTPALITAMKQSLAHQDLPGLKAAAHKIVPSFSIMGISSDFEIISKKLQNYSGPLSITNEIDDWLLQLENVCTQACEELEEEYSTLKYTNS